MTMYMCQQVILCFFYISLFLCSLLEHKEFRFIFPVLPLAMHVCGRYLHSVCEPAPPGPDDKGPQPNTSR